MVTVRIMPSFLREQIARMVALIYKKTRCVKVCWEVPGSYFGDLLTTRFYGMDFKVPAKVEEYLAYRYGEDWRIPNKNYVTLRDDGALRRKDSSVCD